MIIQTTNQINKLDSRLNRTAAQWGPEGGEDVRNYEICVTFLGVCSLQPCLSKVVVMWPPVTQMQSSRTHWMNISVGFLWDWYDLLIGWAELPNVLSTGYKQPLNNQMQRRHKTPQFCCLSMSGIALLDRHGETAETPTLCTSLTTALCYSSLVVIKNRPLPFLKRGHCGVLI